MNVEKNINEQQNPAFLVAAVSGSAFRQLKSLMAGPTRFKIEEAINERPIDVVSIVGDGNCYIVFYYEKQIFNFNEIKPPIGVEVMAYSPEWVHVQYNPKGVRVGFLNEDEEGEFITAKWDNSGDTYENDEEFRPKVWWHF